MENDDLFIRAGSCYHSGLFTGQIMHESTALFCQRLPHRATPHLSFASQTPDILPPFSLLDFCRLHFVVVGAFNCPCAGAPEFFGEWQLSPRCTPTDTSQQPIGSKWATGGRHRGDFRDGARHKRRRCARRARFGVGFSRLQPTKRGVRQRRAVCIWESTGWGL